MNNLFEIKELSAHGNATAKPVIVEVDERGCWNVISHKPKSSGYIEFRRNRKNIKGHRLAYESLVGEIPDGLWVLHHCDNRICVNPAHLFLGDHVDNMADMVRKGRARPCRGIKNGQSKLNDDLVKEIKILARQFSEPHVAKMFGVGHSTVNYIMRGKYWKHVE